MQQGSVCKVKHASESYWGLMVWELATRTKVKGTPGYQSCTVLYSNISEKPSLVWQLARLMMKSSGSWVDNWLQVNIACLGAWIVQIITIISGTRSARKQSGLIATNRRMYFLDWKVNARSKILGIVFQKSRDVLVLQSHVKWHCVYVCAKLYLITSSVYLSSMDNVRHRSVLAEIDMYCLQ